MAQGRLGDWLPSYPTVYLRLTELEPRARDFVELAHHLIKRAREHEREIGRVVFWDGTAAETHAIPEHACQDKAACKAAKQRARKHLQRAPREQAQLIHEAEDALPEDQAPSSKITWLDDTALLAERLIPKDPDVVAFRWFRQGGHLYRLRDTTAGIRTYDKGSGAPKSWCGWLEFKGYDYFTGALLAVTMDAAGTQEMNLYFGVADDVKRATGHHPHIVSGDRGLHFKPFFEFNTAWGIGAALPWR